MMRYRHMAFGAAALLGLGSVALVWAGSGARTTALLDPENQVLVEKGRSIYAAQCASCHGANLEGEPNWRSPKADMTMPAPPHDETGHTWHHNDKILFDLTKFGLGKMLKNADYKSSMPAYAGVLSDEDIIAVLSFIKSNWPEDVRRRHDELNRAGKP